MREIHSNKVKEIICYFILANEITNEVPAIENDLIQSKLEEIEIKEEKNLDKIEDGNAEENKLIVEENSCSFLKICTSIKGLCLFCFGMVQRFYDSCRSFLVGWNIAKF